MKKKSIVVIVFLVSVTLANVPLDISDKVSADSGGDYPYEPTDTVIVSALDFLQSQQSKDGSIGGFAVSSWAAMAISAAGEDPHDWGDLVEYLQNNIDHIDEKKATDWERHALAVVACNENPDNFGGIDFVKRIMSFYDREQIGNSADLYDDFFGIIALVACGVDKDSPVIQTIRVYIKGQQYENGGWGDVDSTAAAVMSLIISGEYNDSDCIKEALSFIKSTQTDHGGFQSWGTTNTASTAWAINAIVAAGQDPTSSEWKHDGNSPVDFLISLQQENGVFNWSKDQNMNPVWMTSYVIPALLGKPYPIKIKSKDSDDEDDDSDNNSYSTDEWTGYIRIEGKNETIWNGDVCFSDSVITALNDSSGEMEDYYIYCPSVLGALEKASQKGGFTCFFIYYPRWDAFYVKTIAKESDWWHYWVDYSLPMIDAGNYELTEEDNEVLFGFLENWNAQALRISASKTVVKKNEKFIVSVYNETMTPIEDAIVYVDSTEYMTDKNGNATVKITAKGTYKIYAEKEGYVRSDREMIKVKRSVEIVKPVNNAIYLNNYKMKIKCQKILIIGAIDIKAVTVDDVEKVEFYINGELEYVDSEYPFKWRLNERAFLKKMKVKLKAYKSPDEVVFKIQQIIGYIESLSENRSTMTNYDLMKSYFKKIEFSLLNQTDVDEKEFVVINIFPCLHELFKGDID